MSSNTHSTQEPPPPSGLASITAGLHQLAAEHPERLPDAVVAEQVLILQGLADQVNGQWLRRLAVVDGRGAAGAEADQQFGSTAAWLRSRLRMGKHTASKCVRTARALFRGPLPAVGQALCDGEVSPEHAHVLAAGTKDVPDHVTAAAEPTLLATARRLDPPTLRQVVGHLCQVTDPDGAETARERRRDRRGLWLTTTLDGMVAIDGLLDPEEGETVRAALEPLARPSDAGDTRSGSQRTADALAELARRQLEAGELPKVGGVRPQLAVVVDLHGLQHPYGSLGGDLGWAGPLDPEACRRLACDAAVTRVVVSRQPGPYHPGGGGGQDHPGHGASGDQGLAAQLAALMTRLPPILGGAPSQPLNLGRSSRVISPAQRSALVVRDGGCGFPDCGRPPAWCDGHHLISWLDGGRTDLPNLALLCRAHHRAVHEGGWHLTRDPDGRFTATPPDRHPSGRRPAGDRRQPVMA